MFYSRESGETLRYQRRASVFVPILPLVRRLLNVRDDIGPLAGIHPGLSPTTASGVNGSARVGGIQIRMRFQNFFKGFNNGTLELNITRFYQNVLAVRSSMLLGYRRFPPSIFHRTTVLKLICKLMCTRKKNM